nr:hypothetical protein [Mycobacterium uberis]
MPRAIVDPVFSMDSVRQGVLSPESGFIHLDDLLDWMMLNLA